MTQSDLFLTDEEAKDSCQFIELEGDKLSYFPSFLNDNDAWHLFDTLYSELDWKQPNIRIAGRDVPIPRKQAWFGDAAYQYTYSGKTFKAAPWHSKIIEIKRAIENSTKHLFNSALCNLYRDGRDSVSWHADNEPELGQKPVIASYSLGETRSFQLRKINDHKMKFNLELNHNSLLIMEAGVQENWEHQVPKSSKQLTPRINITFRKIT